MSHAEDAQALRARIEAPPIHSADVTLPAADVFRCLMLPLLPCRQRAARRRALSASADIAAAAGARVMRLMLAFSLRYARC